MAMQTDNPTAITDDYKLKIATANTRMAKKWKNGEITWGELNKALSKTKVTTETLDEYLHMKKGDQDSIKDVGGFVMGHLAEGLRRAGHVLTRSAVVLDMDFGYPGVLDDLDLLHGFSYVAYGTHKCSAEKPRLRIVIPTSREMTEEEYPAVARMVAKEIGIDLFDDSTYEPHRLMYWPSTPKDQTYMYRRTDRELLDPDVVLAKYDDWHDISTWPVSSRQSVVMKKEVTKQKDPLEKSGPVGAFCRAYPIQDAIEKFLPDVYAPSAVAGRYDYIPGESSAGVQIFDDKFAYSHHATDPACGKLMNAFDLVRTHKFPDEDEKKSFDEMAAFAVEDPKIKAELINERNHSAAADFAEFSHTDESTSADESTSTGEDTDGDEGADGDENTRASSGGDATSGGGPTSGTPAPDAWKAKLQLNRRGQLINNVYNEILILKMDKNIQSFGYNEMANMVQITGPVPWKRPSGTKYWTDKDTAQIKAYVDICYTAFSERNFDIAFTKVSTDRKFNPARDYLDNLPAWDGTERIPTLLIDTFQADDTEYVRAVTKKTLTALVTRIYEPGTKFDTMLVLSGDQGIGKSSFFKDLIGPEYFSDTLSLTDMNDKTGAEKLQGYLIIEVAELAGMKKADIEKVKSFLSTSDDKYRPSYGHVVESHPRQCIIVGTVNGKEQGFLRDITGNRRFWVVNLHQSEQRVNFHFSDADRQQIWAEAKHYYEAGEELYLPDYLIPEAEAAQKDAMEMDDRKGLVENYLDLKLPANWDSMDLFARRQYVQDPDSPTAPKGVVQRTEVSNAEIWCECFGQDLAKIQQRDSYQIAAIMKSIDGWDRPEGRRRIKGYGRQRVYVRTASNTSDRGVDSAS
ncbi:VapE domain-containing protein [Bilifractor sp. HCP3S3_D3]|uniref:VapE domain-containing protein n=1 Tax=Bilifractor sp. HCP3S3_D3 TaxID=3438907 RepID=UPI003F889ED3